MGIPHPVFPVRTQCQGFGSRKVRAQDCRNKKLWICDGWTDRLQLGLMGKVQKGNQLTMA